MSLLTGGILPAVPAAFRSVVSGSQAAQRIRGVSEKSPASASASLMRAPVFHSVPAASCGADPGRNGAGRSLQGQQVFGQFIMNHRHLAECQRCRIIDGNRKLSGIPGMVDRCRQVLHISVHSTGNIGQVFHNPVLSRITELVTATRPDGDNKTPPRLFSGSSDRTAHSACGSRTAHRCRLQHSSSASRPWSVPY